MTPICWVLSKAVVSSFLYFTTDLGKEAFELPFLMWWVSLLMDLLTLHSKYNNLKFKFTIWMEKSQRIFGSGHFTVCDGRVYISVSRKCGSIPYWSIFTSNHSDSRYQRRFNEWQCKNHIKSIKNFQATLWFHSIAFNIETVEWRRWSGQSTSCDYLIVILCVISFFSDWLTIFHVFFNRFSWYYLWAVLY